jgi:hypothetical protein
MIRVFPNGSTSYPYTLTQLRQDFPNVSFPRTPTASDLQPFGVFLVTVVEPPRYEPSTDRLEEIQPQNDRGTWRQRWQTVRLSPKEQADWRKQNVTPRWVEFSTTVMGDPAVNTMLGALIQNVPGLYGGLTVGLQQASVGDTRTFLYAWSAARSRGFVSNELATAVAAMAVNTDLPEEFVSALTSPRP